jgi:branched-subunit amino acid transport protein
VTGLAVLAAAGALSWVLRIGLITLLPAERLPAAFRAALDHLAPAVLAAIVATELAQAVESGAGAGAGAVAAPLLTAAVAGAVAWTTRSLALTVGCGLGAAAALGFLLR